MPESADYLELDGHAPVHDRSEARLRAPAAASKPSGTADPPLTGTLSGFIAADGSSPVYSRAAGEAVGTYAISATARRRRLPLGNYASRPAPRHLRSCCRRPSITASAQPKTLLWSPNKTMVPVTVSGLALGAGLTVTY